jgi:hypothetical protein
VNSSGTVTGQSGGTTSIAGYYSNDWYYYNPYLSPFCFVGGTNSGASSATVNVVSITGPQTVWWFNGQTPSGYTTTITLTATPSGASGYSWAFAQGSDKASFSGQSGNTINLSGLKLSASSGDVQVKVTVNGTTSNPFALTVQGPKSLVAGQISDQSDSTYGYSSYMNYTIKDNLGYSLPSSIPLNENWTTSVVNDYAGANWRRGDPGSLTSPDSTFADHVAGEASGYMPTATAPQSPLNGTTVQHWGQEWRVGSGTVGSGARVQTDNIQKYIDHARHTNIVTPAP